MKKFLMMLFKVILVTGLLYWLISSGKLNLNKLSVIYNQPYLLALFFGVWALCSLTLQSVRWRFLLEGMNIVPAMSKLIQLQSIALFFNTAMPGAVGGDMVKAMYVLKGQRGALKTPVLLTVFLDRLFGFVGLYVIGGLLIAFNMRDVLAFTQLHSFVAFIYLVVFASACLMAWVFFPKGKIKFDPLGALLKLNFPGVSILRQIYAALSLYRSNPWALVKATATSVFIHLILMLFFWHLSFLILRESVDFSSIAVIYPVGILVTTLPIAPGGLGVGHAIFDHLFALVNISGGADIFNLFFLGQMACNLLAAIPYLMVKDQIDLVQSEAQC